LQRGQILGERFEVEQLVGAGGMGVVYRAFDRRNGGPVALKLLQSDQLLSEERFSREAEVLAELSHPAIVAYVANGIAEGRRPFIAMEWLDGETLWKRVEKRPLSIPDALTIGARIGAALEAAHAVGVVHRDVKPSNVFLVGGKIEEAKLVDFGLARPYDRSNPLTVSGTVLGTPEYMAPEQVRGKTDLDPRTDIYGLGALMYRCITGTPPFRAKNLIAALAKVLVEDVPPISSLVPGVPIGLEDLVHGMLAKAPADRPRDAASVVKEVERIQRHLDGKIDPGPAFDRGATREIRGPKPATVILASGLGEERALQEFVTHAEGLGGKVERALGGYAVITFDESDSKEDTALIRAERTLHRLREAAPTAGVSIASIDRTETTGGAIDRAAYALAETEKGRFVEAGKTPAFPDLTPPLVVPAGQRAPVFLKLSLAILLLGVATILALLARAPQDEPRAEVPVRQVPVREAPPAPAVLFLSTDPAGAEVTIAGAPFGVTPTVLRLPAGSVAIDLIKEGFANERIEIDLVQGSEQVVSRNLTALEPKKKEQRKRTRAPKKTDLKPNPFGK
jgi:hypothetical protein